MFDLLLPHFRSNNFFKMAVRDSFSSRFGFIAAAAGSAVGLGNISSFPYEVARGGGGIFLIIYIFFCFALCIPVMLGEIAIGRASQQNTVTAFTKIGHKRWSIIGKLGVLSGVLILSFYNVLAGWSLGYVFEMASGNFCVGRNFSSFTSDLWKVIPSSVIFLALTGFFVSRGISKGIEKLSSYLMPTLIALMIGLSIYGLTLPNALAGLQYYLSPDFSEINWNTIYNAMGQAFFSLSLGMGALITYGSYVNKNEKLISAVTIIALADVGIAFLAGLMIFPLLGFISQGAMDVMNSGPDLIFITLPIVFEELGGSIGVIIGTTFFILLCFAALTSTVSLMEVPVAYIVDKWKIRRPVAVIIMGIIIFVVSLPSLLGNGYSYYFTKFLTIGKESVNFLSFIMSVANDTFLPLGGIMISLFVAYKWKGFHNELTIGNPRHKKSWIRKYITVSLKYSIPVLLLIILIISVYSQFFV